MMSLQGKFKTAAIKCNTVFLLNTPLDLSCKFLVINIASIGAVLVSAK